MYIYIPIIISTMYLVAAYFKVLCSEKKHPSEKIVPSDWVGDLGNQIFGDHDSPLTGSRELTISQTSQRVFFCGVQLDLDCQGA